MNARLNFNKNPYYSSLKLNMLLLTLAIVVSCIFSQGIYKIKVKNPQHKAVSDYVRKRLLENNHYEITSLFGDSDKINYYYIDVYLGKNRDPATLIIDTGSSIMCLTCTSTCVHCGNHENPHFKTEESSTFKVVKCSDSDCSPFPHYKSCSGDSCGFSIVSFKY